MQYFLLNTCTYKWILKISCTVITAEHCLTILGISVFIQQLLQSSYNLL